MTDVAPAAPAAPADDLPATTPPPPAVVKDDVDAVVDADVVVDDNDQPKDEEEEEEPLFQRQLSPRVIVARNHPLSYYVDRCRRILRIEDRLYVSGRGNTISMTCTLVEILKRQKIGIISSIKTGMNVEPYFSSGGDARWAPPTSMITFEVVPDIYAKFISDYHQRKVIEIFENTDKDQNGTLTFKEIESLDFANKFKANDEQINNANKFLNDSKQSNDKLDLPNFIRYASLLIHPLLKDKMFKKILNDEFQIFTKQANDKKNDDQT